ncbi:response regulator [Lunatibacter salilacus]|uniref:response regulator n=1 Tax=Lunatibacter salilacus TaxID=2483804 RepID=UPI00131AF084|nr:response regulator [Lunatibacter salilacus]
MENNRGKCILIYEDNQEILILCKTILTRKHYRVETRLRCENVINDIDSVQPDLVLMDLWIPEIGGEKAVSLIKGNPATRDIPVLLFSANADIKEICKRTNANGYLEKPFDLKTFIATIEEYIK